MPAPMNRALLGRMDPDMRQLMDAIIENIERLTGQRSDLPPIEKLPPGASAADTLRKVNEYLERAQG